MGHKLSIVLIISFVVPVLLFAGEPQTDNSSSVKTFVREIRGVGGLATASQTSDGSYLSVSRYGESLTVTKMSPSGEQLWKSSFQIDQFTTINGISEVNDGYILVGYATDYFDYFVSVLIKLDTSGKRVWSKSIQNSLSLSTLASQPDGTFIAAGVDGGFPVLIKFSAAGAIVWTKTFDVSLHENEYAFGATSDNGLVLAFTKNKDGDRSAVYLIKLNSDGHSDWNRKLHVKDVGVRSIRSTSDGGILLLGSGNRGSVNMLVSLNSRGHFQWAAHYSSHDPNNRSLFLNDITQTSDGGYALVGWAKSYDVWFEGPRYAILLKIDANGKLVFQKRFGSDEFVIPAKIFSTLDSRYMIFGSTQRPNSKYDRQLMLSVNSNGLVSGCNYLTAIDSVRRKTVAEIKSSSKFRLEKGPDRSYKVKNLSLSNQVDAEYRIQTICE